MTALPKKKQQQQQQQQYQLDFIPQQQAAKPQQKKKQSPQQSPTVLAQQQKKPQVSQEAIKKQTIPHKKNYLDALRVLSTLQTKSKPTTSKFLIPTRKDRVLDSYITMYNDMMRNGKTTAQFWQQIKRMNTPPPQQETLDQRSRRVMNMEAQLIQMSKRMGIPYISNPSQRMWTSSTGISRA